MNTPLYPGVRAIVSELFYAFNSVSLPPFLPGTIIISGFLVFFFSGCAFHTIRNTTDFSIVEETLNERMGKNLFQLSLYGKPCMLNEKNIPTGSRFLDYQKVHQPKDYPEAACSSYAVEGWYPVEIFITHPGSRLFINDRSASEVANLYKYARKEFHPANTSLAEYYPTYNLEDHKQFRSRGNYTEYRIRGRKRDSNWTAGISLLTLFVFPSYADESFDAEVLRHSSSSGSTRIPGSSPEKRSWISWLFFLWGPALLNENKETEYLHFILDPMTEEHKNSRIQIRYNRAPFAPHSSGEIQTRH